jgi:hypothetical protein
LKLIALATLSIAIATLSSGCATIVAPRYERLSVTSNPPGATIVVNGHQAGITPKSVDIDKSKPPNVRVEAPGYQTKQCYAHMNVGIGYLVADIALCVFTFGIGCVSFIDAMGPWNELVEHNCDVTLEPAMGGMGGMQGGGYVPPPPGGYAPPPPGGTYVPPPPGAYVPPPPPNP